MPNDSSTRSRLQKKTSQRPSELEMGKVPPQAVELEQAVLGALMMEKDALTEVIDILQSDSFYEDAHQRIYKAIKRLFEASKPVDILTVTEELRNHGELEMVGGAYYITELTNNVASSAHVEHHAHIITQKYIQRELIRISNEIIKEAYEDTTDVFELLDKAESNLFAITDTNLRRSSEDMHSLVERAIKEIEEVKDQETDLTGVPSGFSEVDRVTSGWQDSDLIIVAGRPSMGKTAFTLSVARNAAVDFDKRVAIFSLEMSGLQLVNRLISAEAELAMNKIKNGNLEPHEWQQLNAKVGGLADANIFIDDTPAINIFELRAKCRRLKSKHDLDLIIVDYLQLMSGTGDKKNANREQEISTISRSLKKIAKELELPVIALSQLSRKVEMRGGSKRPQLSDLRESGAIEQDADLVTFLSRPEYYGFTEDEEGRSLEGIAELIIAKHRNGPLADVPIRFIDKFAKFVNLENYDMGQEMGTDDDEGPNVITRKSRMNEMGEGGKDKNEDEEENLPF
jgi:replicative DNA helicase